MSALLLFACARAQNDLAVRVVNTGPFDRNEWALATVPFPMGEWTAGRTYHVPGIPSYVTPFGAPWPDGSVRFGQLAVRAHVPAGGERIFQVRRGSSNLDPFQVSEWVRSRSPGYGFEILASIPGVGLRRVAPKLHEVVINDPTRQVVHYRDRISDTDLVYDLWITWFADQDNAPFELRITSSQVGTASWEQPVNFIALLPTNCMPVIRGGHREGVMVLNHDPGGVNPAVLLGETTFWDGQAYEWFGDLVFWDDSVTVPDRQLRLETLGAVHLEPWYGVATNWKSSGAYGPFGYLPEPPPWMTDGGVAAAWRDRAEFLQWYYSAGAEWENRPFGLLPYAAATGQQHDFGVGKLVDIFYTGMPFLIEAARYSAGEEAQRPVHHREPDGRMVTARNHPLWVALSGRTMWSKSVSPDRLKPDPHPSMRDKTHDWTGKDSEHWSSLTLSAAYLLTGSNSLLMELRNDAELYMATHTLPSLRTGIASNNVGTPRAVGRTLLSMSWNYLVTGNDRLADWMRSRVDECIVPHYQSLATTGPVHPLRLKGPDARSISTGDHWVPWEEAQAVLGLEACARVTGSFAAHDTAYRICRNLINYGWRIDFGNTKVAYGLRWIPGGIPLQQHQLSSPEWAKWASSAFNVWCLPSTRLALQYAQMYNHSEMFRRAAAILEATEALRQPPRSGPPEWDDYAEWDAIR